MKKRKGDKKKNVEQLYVSVGQSVNKRKKPKKKKNSQEIFKQFFQDKIITATSSEDLKPPVSIFNNNTRILRSCKTKTVNSKVESETLNSNKNEFENSSSNLVSIQLMDETKNCSLLQEKSVIFLDDTIQMETLPSTSITETVNSEMKVVDDEVIVTETDNSEMKVEDSEVIVIADDSKIDDETNDSDVIFVGEKKQAGLCSSFYKKHLEVTDYSEVYFKTKNKFRKKVCESVNEKNIVDLTQTLILNNEPPSKPPSISNFLATVTTNLDYIPLVLNKETIVSTKNSYHNLHQNQRSEQNNTETENNLPANVINEFGNNLYNAGSVNRQGLRMIVIDGSNVAMGHSNGKFFSVKGLKICIDYFLKRGHNVKAFVPHYRSKLGESSNSKLLQTLQSNGHVIFTPSRNIHKKRICSYDDRYIVQCAAANEGIIVSSDNYRDLMLENPSLRPTIEERLLMPTWVDDLIIFPPDPLGKFGPSLDDFLKFP